MANCYQIALSMPLEAGCVRRVQGPRGRHSALSVGVGWGNADEVGRSAMQRWKEQSTSWDGAWEGCVCEAAIAGQQQQQQLSGGGGRAEASRCASASAPILQGLAMRSNERAGSDSKRRALVVCARVCSSLSDEGVCAEMRFPAIGRALLDVLGPCPPAALANSAGGPFLDKGWQNSSLMCRAA